MTDTTALTAKLEAAEGPSRELDAEICIAVEYAHLPPDVTATACTDGTVTIEPKGTAPIFDDAKCYTASIDAALTLVPEGYGFSLHCMDANQTICQAHVCDEIGDACTPALALCISALRARED
jgi:hypothetical protein